MILLFLNRYVCCELRLILMWWKRFMFLKVVLFIDSLKMLLFVVSCWVNWFVIFEVFLIVCFVIFFCLVCRMFLVELMMLVVLMGV